MADNAAQAARVVIRRPGRRPLVYVQPGNPAAVARGLAALLRPGTFTVKPPTVAKNKRLC